MPGQSNPTLLSIISHARAGALDRAWQMFGQSGLIDKDDDPRVLTVKGRLLKDKARRARGDERRNGFAQAANAYAAAARLDGATYPLINAATLALLAGDKASAQSRAQEALARIDSNPDEPETPFYKLATKAEAMLLLGRQDEAFALLGQGVALAPLAWEDHASTLRQFELILAQQDRSAHQLDKFRPPSAIHYSGHILIGGEESEKALRSQIDSWLMQHKIGFAFGALAAGADIVVAEAVCDCGGELHVVLPCGLEAFAAHSVEPFGKDWLRRFEALIEKADTLRCNVPANSSPGDLDIALADRTAMGLAIMQARTLATTAHQLLILSKEAQSAPQPGASVKAAQHWAALNLPQHTIEVEREGPAVLTTAGLGQRLLAACLAVRPVALADAPEPQADGLRRAVAMVAAYDQPIAPGWHDEQAVFAFAEMGDALAAGVALAGEGFAVAGDLMICRVENDPLNDGKRLARQDVEALLGAARTVLADGFHATETFAAAALTERQPQIEVQQVCEMEMPGQIGAVPIFSLRAALENQLF